MLYQLSYPAVGGRIIENCWGFVKIELGLGLFLKLTVVQCMFCNLSTG